jgi:hypothetical protein
MSATDAFNTPTTTALSASDTVTGAPPLDDLISSVWRWTFSIMPRTRCACCAEATVTATAVTKAAVVKIRTVFMDVGARGQYTGRRPKTPAKGQSEGAFPKGRGFPAFNRRLLLHACASHTENSLGTV